MRSGVGLVKRVAIPTAQTRQTGPQADPMLIRRIGPDPFRSPEHKAAAKKKRVNAEHLEQCALVQWATLNEKNIPQLRNLFAIPNGGDRHFAVAAKLKAEGVKKGTFDLMLAVVCREKGAIVRPGLFIEMKHGKNKATPEQLAFKNRMVAEGYACWVCYTWKDAANVIVAYLGPEYRRFRVA